jgi:hypothetical protein
LRSAVPAARTGPASAAPASALAATHVLLIKALREKELTAHLGCFYL